jgi:hypothetical protein
MIQPLALFKENEVTFQPLRSVYVTSFSLRESLMEIEVTFVGDTL